MKNQWIVVEKGDTKVNFSNSTCAKCQQPVELGSEIQYIGVANNHGFHASLCICNDCRDSYEIGQKYN